MTKEKSSMKGWMYILECVDGSYYTGSTKNLDLRLAQHQAGAGANHTKKRLPVKLIYFEEFQRVDQAFYREKQVQGWSRKKKEALMNGLTDELKKLAECMNETHCRNCSSGGFGSAQPPCGSPLHERRRRQHHAAPRCLSAAEGNTNRLPLPERSRRQHQSAPVA